MTARRQQPAYRIGYINAQGAVVVYLEHRHYPENSEAARAAKRDYHRRDRAVERAQTSAEYVHKSAEEVGEGRVDHSLHTEGDDLLLVRRAVVGKEDAEKRFTKGVGHYAERDADDEDEREAVVAGLLDSLDLHCAEVLTREGQGGVVEGIERDIDESVDRARCAVAGNADLIEGVDRGLNDNVREGEETALNSRGDTDLYDLSEEAARDTHMAQIELAFVVKSGKAENNEDGGEVLRDDRSKRDARDVKVEDDDEEHIAGYVYGSREHKEVERALRVALGAQKCGTVVIDHLRGHTEKDYAHIKRLLTFHKVDHCVVRPPTAVRPLRCQIGLTPCQISRVRQ